MERRGDYGYDAPYALLAFTLVGAACTVGALVSLAWVQRRPLSLALGFYGVFFLANAWSFFYTTRRGKFQVWGDVLEQLHLRGDERVLDMGCGRGAVLVAVARRLRSGRVTGIDLWSSHETFDLVVSSLAIHNIRSDAARAKAIGEAWRVLKPGGRVAIADIRVTGRYAATFRKLGAVGVTRRRLGWRFWYGNPFAGTTLVTASKPA